MAPVAKCWMLVPVLVPSATMVQVS
jgi:hypothetical protein